MKINEVEYLIIAFENLKHIGISMAKKYMTPDVFMSNLKCNN